MAVALAAGSAAASTTTQASTIAHYDIHAHFDLQSKTVEGETIITLPPEEAGRSAEFVLSDRIKVRKADGGRSARVSIAPTDQPYKGLNKITFTFDRVPTHPVVLRFSYAGTLDWDKGLRIDPRDGVELSLEDMWVPLRPDFGLLFTADADLSGIAPDAIAVGQGELRRKGDHIRIHRAFPDWDMPFAALSGLKVIHTADAEIYSRNPDGPLESALQRDAAAIVAYYTRLFGPPPPHSMPERVVILPRQGRAYTRRAYVCLSDPTEELKKLGDVEEWRLIASTAHEFAHAWWFSGSPFTENNWLNESMAEYSSLRFTEAFAGAAALKYRLDRKIEAARTAGSVIGHGRLGKAVLYQKGPVLLFELDTQIGRASMDRFLAALGREPLRTTEQFLATLSNIAGPDVAHDFQAKLSAE